MKDSDTPIVDMLTLRRDLYFVMSLLLADREVGKVPGMTVWTQVFHDNEVRRLMLWVATAIRSLLDGLDPKKDVFSRKPCGEYWPDFPNGAKEPLQFRQACNSVIHAKEILLYKAPQQESTRKAKRVYTGRVTVRSTRGSRKTRAQLDIIGFVQIADTMINSFEEGNHANIQRHLQVPLQEGQQNCPYRDYQ